MVARIITVNLVLSAVFMTAFFLAAKSRQRIDTVDTAWGLGFVLVAWATAAQQWSGRTFLVAVLVSFWGIRLSVHIWRRGQGRPDDPRYRALSQKWKGNFWLRAYVSVFLLQAVLAWLISLPVMVIAGQPLRGGAWVVTVGSLVWLAGFVFESIADKQLGDFMKKDEKPEILQTGLWRYSRHPNYFGELTLWWGIGIIALHASYGWIGLAGPLILTFLIVFVSGIPPIEKRHAKNPAYKDYRRQTSPLIPLPPRR